MQCSSFRLVWHIRFGITQLSICGILGQYNFVPPRRHPTAVPPVAVVPPIRVFRDDPGCGGRAPGFYSNPDNCYKFYRCVDEVAYLKRYDFDCAPGTAFDPTLSVCNFPGQGGTFQECERREPPPQRPQVVIQFEPEPEPVRPPQRRPAVSVLVQQGQGYGEKDYTVNPNPGNYGQREPNYGNRRPTADRINDRQPNPNRGNVRFWSNRNNYADYEK